MNWWEAGGASGCVAAYQSIGAASLAASYVNLANPGTHDLTVVVAPAWSSGVGWTFGSGRFLTADIQPANDQSWSAIVAFSGASGPDDIVFGQYNAGSGLIIQPVSTTTKRAIYNGFVFEVSGALSSGVMSVSGNKMYTNGVADAGTAPIWGAAAWPTLGIGGFTSFVGDLPYSTATITALAVYSTVLDAPQNAALYTCISALPAACGGSAGLPVIARHWRQAH